MSKHHGGDGGDKPPRHPLTIPDDYESASPPKRRQHYKSLTIYELFNKLGAPIPIQFDLEGLTFMLLDSILSIMFGILESYMTVDSTMPSDLE